MPIDLSTAEHAIGRVVRVRLTGCGEELRLVSGVRLLGGMVYFEDGRMEVCSSIDWLHPVTVSEAAQVLADANAVAGKRHEAPRINRLVRDTSSRPRPEPEG